MFAGSVMTRTSTPASAIFLRVRASRSVYSPSGNAAIRHLLVRLRVEHQVLEHALCHVDVLEMDPLVGPVRGLVDVTGSEQHAWYPRAVHEEAGVAGGAPGGDARVASAGPHRRLHRAHQGVVARNLERNVVRAGDRSEEHSSELKSHS